MQKIKLIVIVLGLLVITGCKDHYEIELRPSDRSLLVVEGFLNKGHTSSFRLSRTVDLSESISLKPELQAWLMVEGKDNSSAAFAEMGNGFYEASLGFLEIGKEYRLRIRTSDGREYLSTYVEVKDNPAIDSVSWRHVEDNAVRVYVSTHDPANKTHYYRWDFDETWEIRSFFRSGWKRKGNDSIVLRDLITEDVSVCWKYDASTNILLGSSAQLTSDVISESPLLLIPRTSEKLEQRYSILVRQYVLSKEAYEYFDLLKKNTESLGTIFSPQPSEVRGNIYSVNDPAEQVIGFVTASAVQEKRIFISANELNGRGSYLFCETVQIQNHPDSIAASIGFEPYNAIYGGPGIKYWDASTARCVDCTSRGGSTTKPSYW
jgi:hypothetical protein